MPERESVKEKQPWKLKRYLSCIRERIPTPAEAFNMNIGSNFLPTSLFQYYRVPPTLMHAGTCKDPSFLCIKAKKERLEHTHAQTHSRVPLANTEAVVAMEDRADAECVRGRSSTGKHRCRPSTPGTHLMLWWRWRWSGC
eukprot:1161713-Pelagomonas_calceolata.AAC.8